MTSALTYGMVRERFGITLQPENTGGGALAHVGRLEDDYLLVLTDGNYGDDLDGEQGADQGAAAVWDRRAWEDGDQSEQGWAGNAGNWRATVRAALKASDA